MPPPREPLSAFIPRTSSLAFHPKEMIYAVGNLDGIGMFCLYCLYTLSNTPFSPRDGMQIYCVDPSSCAIFSTFLFVVDIANPVIMHHIQSRMYLSVYTYYSIYVHHAFCCYNWCCRLTPLI